MHVNLIQAVPGWDSLTAAEILTALTAEYVTKKSPARYGYDGLAAAMGAAQMPVSTVRAVMKGIYETLTVSDPAFALQLAGGALDFSSDLVQDALTELADEAPEVFSETTVAFLKGLGIDNRSRWQRAHGDAEPPTEEAIEDALLRLRTLLQFQALAPVVEEHLSSGASILAEGAPATWAVDGFNAVMLAMRDGETSKVTLTSLFASNDPAGE